jgi:hypothetical protein
MEVAINWLTDITYMPELTPSFNLLIVRNEGYPCFLEEIARCSG